MFLFRFWETLGTTPLTITSQKVMENQDYKTPEFYTIRYIISSCMTEAEARFVRSSPNTINWKKSGIPCKICLQSGNWKNLDVKERFGTKEGITDVKYAKASDMEKTPYITITYKKGETFSFTASHDTLKRFYCGISLVLQRDISNDQLFKTTMEQYEKMIANQKKFFAKLDFNPPPPIPPEPASLPVV